MTGFELEACNPRKVYKREEKGELPKKIEPGVGRELARLDDRENVEEEDREENQN